MAEAEREVSSPYDRLLDDLRIVKCALPAAEVPLELAIGAIAAVTRFLSTDPNIRAERLANPLEQLAIALANHLNGRSHPLLKVPRRSKGRPKDPASDIFKGYVIHVLDVLIALPHGPGRNGAAVLVSDELARHGIQYSPQTVLGWRDEANQNDVMPMVQDIRKQLKNLRIEANPPSASPKDIVTQLIPAASERFVGIRKKPPF